MASLSLKGMKLYLGSDIIALILTFSLTLFFYGHQVYTKIEWSLIGAFFFLWLLIKYWRRINYTGLNNSFQFSIADYFRAYLALIIFVLLLYLFFPIIDEKKHIIAVLIISFPVLSISLNYGILKFIEAIVGHRENVKYTLVAGTGKLAQVVENKLNAKKAAHYRIQGFVSCFKNEKCVVGENKVIGDIKDMNQYLKTHHIDEILIALPVKPSRKILNIIEAADYHGVRVKYIPDYSTLLGAEHTVSQKKFFDTITIHQSPLDHRPSLFLKNCFDKLFSAIALTLLAPLFLLLALLIKLESHGPVFYCPMRIGKGGSVFKLYKFRSMQENDATSGGMLSTEENDPRITRLGKIMRKYSLDELPQFINVFQGTMSIVGPRPHRSYLNQQFQESVNKYMTRHYIKPGITGWAQINGWRGPTKTEEQKKQRTSHDLWYVENWSFWLDIKIIFKTIFSSKVHKNAF